MNKIAILSMMAAATFLMAACADSAVNVNQDAEGMENEMTVVNTENVLPIDYSASSIEFIGSKGDGAVTHLGSFEDFEVMIELDSDEPDNYEKASVRAAIDITSIETDTGGLTNHLKQADFFDLDNYTTAKFQSESITKLNGNSYQIDGNLTIKDVSQPVMLLATIDDGVAEIAYEMNRLDFGVGTAEIADEQVQLSIIVNFQE